MENENRNSETEQAKIKVLQKFHTYIGDAEEVDPELSLRLLEKNPLFKPKEKRVFEKIKISYNANGNLLTIESSKKVFRFVWTFDNKLSEVTVTLKPLSR